MHSWDPARYEKSSSAQYEWAKALISGLDLEGDERVLDIGCGDGRITSEIADLVPGGRVLGIDLSREMIDFARSRHDRRNLAFEVGDASSLVFLNEFDLVVSFACLHWVEDHLPVLEGIRRSLRPGGQLLFQCGGRGNAADLLDLTGEVIKSDRWAPYFEGFRFPYHFYGPEEYGVWVKEAGLSPVRVELVPKVMVHKGKEGLAGIIRATWLPYTERLPEDLRPEFISEVAERYLEDHPLEDGLVRVRMMRLEVEALRD